VEDVKKTNPSSVIMSKQVASLRLSGINQNASDRMAVVNAPQKI
jgi:hypothetical protein